MVKLCECGCGKPAPIATCTAKRDGWVKGQAKRLIRGHNFKSRRSETGLKICTQCEMPKEDDQFSNKYRVPSGRASVCRVCRHKEYIGRRDEFLKAARDNRLGEGATDYFNEQKTKQNDRCDICGRAVPLNLDHCHTTGKWRGALCARCNAGIGMFMEKTKLLMLAVSYLIKWR